jgi:hypothetical protein
VGRCCCSLHRSSWRHRAHMKWVAAGSETESTQSDAAKMNAHSAVAS